jgi:hypothetical protein
MARFDPETYPDRLEFIANARRIRAEELGRIHDAVASWLRSRLREFAGRVVAAATATSHRHATH